MFLWGLAWHNTRRNWIRTILVVASMVAASFILAASLSMTSGHLPWAFPVYRAFMGGDLVVYPLEVMLDREGATGNDGRSWSWQPWPEPWINDLVAFHPSLVDRGLIVPRSQAPPYFDADDLPPEILDHPDVVSVAPQLVMPGLLRQGPGAAPAPLRALMIERGAAQGWPDLITRGRYFEPEDEGLLVALVNAASPAYWPRSHERQYPVPPLWEFITIEVPTLVGWRDGYPVYDYSQMNAVNLRVVGHYSLPTYENPVMDADGIAVTDLIGQVIIFPHYWLTPQVVIPESTWRAIYYRVSGGAQVRSYQLGVSVRDTLTAETVSRGLDASLPGRTVRTVAAQVLLGDTPVRIASQVPEPRVIQLMSTQLTPRQPVTSPDLSRLVAALSFVLAGCLVMANMHILVAQRRKELGILRALGMSGSEVLKLIIYEILVLSTTGSLIGFSMVKILVGTALIASGGGVAEVLAGITVSAIQVMGATVMVSVLFGLWPAMKAARATTMEVLTGE